MVTYDVLKKFLMFLSLTQHISSTDNCQYGLGSWYMVRLSGEIEPNYIASYQVTFDVLKINLMILI